MNRPDLPPTRRLAPTRRGFLVFPGGLAAGLALGVVPGGAAAQTAAPDPRLVALAERYWDETQALFPVDATENTGDPAYEALLEIEIAPAHRERQRALYAGVERELRDIDATALSGADRTTHALLAWEIEQGQAQLAHPWHLLPVEHMNALPVRLAQWAGGEGSQPMKTTAHYEHFLARLGRLPAWIDQAIVNQREGVRLGITLPRPLVQRVLPQLDALLPADAAASPFLAGVRAFPDTVPEADRARLADAYRAVVAGEIAPAVRRLRDHMGGPYLAAARATSGLGALPGGAAWYRVQARSSTTTSLTPEAIHALGLAEVAKIRAGMEEVKKAFGFDGPLDDFLRSLDRRPALKPFKTEAEVLAAYGALHERVARELPRLFERAPKAALVVRAVEPMRRATASDHYLPPAADGSRPGAFFTVITDPAKYMTPAMTALYLHEGQPGHHYQIALQQELDLPRFRRHGGNNAYVEGWALYAEGLGDELGLYADDPAARLGRLQMGLHRALRLVVDTGLHAMGWSRERAMALLQAQEARSADSARRAIERYMAWPGQALAYKVGELKILELRERARTALGPKFDLRAFHSRVLEEGAMPLAMLEAKIDRWIAQARA